MRPSLPDRIQSLSLKWKLLIPFLFFAFAGTTTLSYIGLSSQQKLIRHEEETEILHYYRLFLEGMAEKKNQALSLATVIAENREVGRLLAERRRDELRELMNPTFMRLKWAFHIQQVHFHVPPATSFLRLHRPEWFGEDMAPHRKTIADAVTHRAPRGGLEMGRTGLAIRGVVPVYHGEELVGTVEAGHSFGADFLAELHGRWAVDVALYAIAEDGTLQAVAKSGEEVLLISIGPEQIKEGTRGPICLIAPEGYLNRAFLIGPVRDYSGRVVALLELGLDRTQIEQRLTRTRNLMILVGLAGIIISFLLTYLVAILFIRPIRAIVIEAQEIAEEKRESRIEPRPKDEIGVLTEALNVMLEALRARRMEIENYARVLERRVEERTADLVASEEKFRTLVENVPLIVYRILPDGTTEFINPYLTDVLGYTIEEAVGDRDFWCEKIWGSDRRALEEFWDRSFQDGNGAWLERVVMDKNGRPLTFIDHAMPAWDARGRVRWVDGIMMDITELKRYQEQAFRTEEIRLLGEISAHMAHEIRNPLSTTGGFARRLRDSLPEEDPRHRIAGIIVSEAARMEQFLKALISSIRPFDLSLGQVDVNEIVLHWLGELEQPLQSRGIRVLPDLAPALPVIRADGERLGEAIGNLFKHAIVTMVERDELQVSTSRRGDRVAIILRHRVRSLSEHDMDNFFFPHIQEKSEWPILDLSLSRRIVHRHGGKIELNREGDLGLVMRIELPIGREGQLP